MAHLVQAGARVVLLTATRGEGGEVIGAPLAHLAGDRAGLAAHREQELAAALQALGVTEHAYLGQSAPEAAAGFPARRFEDSGMVWGEDGHAHAPATMSPDALCAADLDEVAGRIAAVIDALDPHLVLTYGADGGYGHPDHRRCHDGTVRALRRGGPARAERTRLLTIANPPQAVAATFDATAPGFDLTGFTPAEAPSTIADDVPLAVSQDVEDLLGTKAMAMAAHATQVTVAGDFFALSNKVGQRIGTTEHFALADFAKSAEAPIRALPDGTVDEITLLAPERSPGGRAPGYEPGGALPTGAAAGAAGATAAAASATVDGRELDGDPGRLPPRTRRGRRRGAAGLAPAPQRDGRVRRGPAGHRPVGTGACAPAHDRGSVARERPVPVDDRDGRARGRRVDRQLRLRAAAAVAGQRPHRDRLAAVARVALRAHGARGGHRLPALALTPRVVHFS